MKQPRNTTGRFPNGRYHAPGEAPNVIEDATFIADTGYGLTEAARRLEFYTPGALERYLQKHDAHALARRLRAHDWLPQQYLDGGYDHHNQHTRQRSA